MLGSRHDVFPYANWRRVAAVVEPGNAGTNRGWESAGYSRANSPGRSERAAAETDHWGRLVTADVLGSHGEVSVRWTGVAMFFNHTTPHRLELSGEVLGRDVPCPEGPSGDGLSGCAPSPIVRRVIVDAKGCAGNGFTESPWRQFGYLAASIICRVLRYFAISSAMSTGGRLFMMVIAHV